METQTQQQPIIVRKSSGCLPFGCGCLTGMFLIVFVMIGSFAGLIYFGGTLLEKGAVSVYENHVRPQLEASLPLPAPQKKQFMGDLDNLMARFPEMSLSEKQQAFEDFFKKYEALLQSGP